MYFAYRGSAATLLFLAALALPSGARADGGAVYIKGGAMRLHDTGQVFDTAAHIPVGVSVDDISYKTIDLGWEIRLRHGWAVGAEYLAYNNRFIEPASPAARDVAMTDAFMVAGKKYFFDSGAFHPYVGGGFGIGFTEISNDSSGGQLATDINVALFLHAMLGIELRVDNLSFMLEAKTLYWDSSQLKYDVEYNPTATGLLLGMGFNW